MGSIYKRGDVYWIKYYRRGRPFRESCGREASYDEAKRTLAQREGDIAKGLPITSKINRIKIDELLEDFKNEYKINGLRSYSHAARFCDKHLVPFFGGKKAACITTADIRAYIIHRQRQEASNATINRELAAMKRAYHLARENGKALFLPHFPMLKESNVRKGFFEYDQLLSLLKHLPEYLKSVVGFAYITGWRTISEILPLEWRQVDFKAGVVTLDVGTTKNEEARVFPLTQELRKVLEEQRKKSRALSGKIIPWVFHRNGEPMKSYRKAWATACKKAGLPGKIPHDFRRTAVRNLVRAGVPERVAMRMTGHKTRSVFDRYNIVSEGDLKDAARKLDNIAKDMGTDSGTILEDYGIHKL